MTTDLTEVEWPRIITRTFPLEDIDVRSGQVTCERCGRDATGRMVQAYAAVFDIETEVHDQHGHYNEVIDRAAFNRTISNWSRSKGIGNVTVFYNHAKTLYDTPSEMASVPLGHPSMIRANASGVLTDTHYTRDDFSDRILQRIIDGDISGHSFTGRIYRSDPERPPRMSRGGELPRVRRLEMGLSEYGPTPIPYYETATVLAVRSGRATGGHAGDGSGSPAPPHPTSGTGPADSPSALRAAEIRRRIDAFNVMIGGKLPRSSGGPTSGDPDPAGGHSE